MTNSISDIADAGCILAIGTNTTEAHPVMGFEIKQAVRRGTKLIVANPREIELVRHADLWLKHRPGTDVPLLMGICRVIIDEELLNTAFVSERTENFKEFKESLQQFSPDFVEEITGVPREKMAEAARMYATHSPAAIFYAMGITQHSHGTDNVIAVADLAMLTGNIGKAGSGVNPLRGQNNVQGACDVGALPNVYPGYQSVANPDIKAKFEAAWGCSLPPTKPGLTVTEIMDAAHQGKIKAMYILGENPVLSDAQAKHVEVSIRHHDGELVVETKDDGIGFDADQTSFADGEPTGFGLFSIRERVSHLGGRLEIDSRRGRGSRITLRVPCQEPMEPEGGRSR